MDSATNKGGGQWDPHSGTLYRQRSRREIDQEPGIPQKDKACGAPVALHPGRSQQKKPDCEDCERYEPSSRPSNQNRTYEPNQRLEEGNRDNDWYEQWLGGPLDEEWMNWLDTLNT